MPPDITVEFAAAVVEAVRAVAAEEILPRYRSVTAERKPDGSLVTEADFAAQHALAVRLARIETVPLLGEEMERAAQDAIWQEGGRYWCVDPLDGTANFAASVPFFGVSVALMDGGRALFGTVFDPIRDEAYFAVRGAGAWLGAKPLRVPSTAPPLREALAEVSLRRDTKSLRGAIKRHPPYRKRITSGASTLSWCHLATGRIDVILSGGQKMWDYAAGALILEEAGGFASTLESDEFWAAPAWNRSVIAARSAPLLAEWRAWVRTQLVAHAGGVEQSDGE
jgi:myo-inositol-1(or 4)-monophosphatase